MVQRKRVLRALQQAGDHGICSVDFAAPQVIDGGPPIMRVAARIEELRSEGFIIGDAGQRHGTRVYVLGLEDRSRALFDQRPTVTRTQHPEHSGLATYTGTPGMSIDDVLAHIARDVFARARVNLSEAA